MGLLWEEWGWAQQAEAIRFRITTQALAFVEYFELPNHLINPDNPVKKAGLVFLALP